jgi:hypothetical protein
MKIKDLIPVLMTANPDHEVVMTRGNGDISQIEGIVESDDFGRVLLRSFDERTIFRTLYSEAADKVREVS